MHPAAALRRVFGSAPPKEITQEAFEGNPRHLRRLARLRPGEKAEVRDIWEYTQDLLYTDIQGPLFTYLLPFCLEAWREDLRGTSSEYGGFVEHFYPVLANRQVFDRVLTAAQSTAISDFMRASILEEIDDQRGLAYRGSGARPYRWITALTTHGVLLPDVNLLWNDWWTVDTVGRAVAVVQYVSCLMYEKTDNPVFAPWTPNGGGGPPCLWEFGGHLYTNRWLEPNVAFLRRTLNLGTAGDVLNRAVERLAGQPERDVAAGVLDDVALCEDILTARCAHLPCLLETRQGPGDEREW
jgi:hypothetical protein